MLFVLLEILLGKMYFICMIKLLICLIISNVEISYTAFTYDTPSVKALQNYKNITKSHVWTNDV